MRRRPQAPGQPPDPSDPESLPDEVRWLLDEAVDADREGTRAAEGHEGFDRWEAAKPHRDEALELRIQAAVLALPDGDIVDRLKWARDARRAATDGGT